MSLPGNSSNKPPFTKLKSLILPLSVAALIALVIVVGIFVIKNNQNNKSKKNIGVYTEPKKFEIQKGKTVTLAPTVLQISPEELRADLVSNKEITLLTVFTGESWKDPHIKGTMMVLKSNFDSTLNLDKSKVYVYISDDGYDGAQAAAKMINYGFPKEKNINLEGGLEAWKAKGYSVEN